MNPPERTGRFLAALLASGFSILLWGASPALARPTLSGPESLIDSTHFRVHYTTSGADATTAANAQTLLSNAEKGYSAEVTQWQFPAPLSDGSLGGDSRIDIYVSASVPGGYADPDTNNNSTSGSIDVNPTYATLANVVEHELFHLIQYTHFLYPANWIREGTAEWASTHIEGTSPFYLYQYFTRPFVPLNCSSTSSPDGGNCGGSFRDDAYGRNTFWEYLSERPGFGEGIIKDVVIGEPTTSLTPANALDGVNDALSKHGTTLAQAFLDFTTANVSGNYTLAGLAGRTPVPDSTISTGTTDASYPAQSFTVDHLAARYIRYEAATSSCHSATLHLSVTGPAGLASQPVFFDGDGHGPYLPTVNGGPVDIPWGTCGGAGTLAVPNASFTQDGQQFMVLASLTLPSPQSAPPAESTGPQSTPSPIAARVLLLLPRSVRVSRRSRLLTLQVMSTGAKRIAVELRSSVVRATFHVHNGVNRLRIRLPRRFRPGRHRLTLAVFSPTGQRTQVIRRAIVIRFVR